MKHKLVMAGLLVLLVVIVPIPAMAHLPVYQETEVEREPLNIVITPSEEGLQEMEQAELDQIRNASPAAEDRVEVGVGFVVLTPEDIRDPEIALQHRILGYVELTWMDVLPPSAMRPGETWTGKWLAHFVSHTCEVTEAELHIEPGEGAYRAGRYYTGEDGTEVFLDYSRFLRYWPQGVFKIKADETMVIEVTLRVPADLPRRIQDLRLYFRLYPYDIWVGEHQDKMPKVALLYADQREVQIIHDPLPLEDP